MWIQGLADMHQTLHWPCTGGMSGVATPCPYANAWCLLWSVCSWWEHTLSFETASPTCRAWASLSSSIPSLTPVLCLLVCLPMQGLSIILPALPQLATNYFASRHAGYPIDCDAYSMSEQPKACQVGSSGSCIKAAQQLWLFSLLWHRCLAPLITTQLPFAIFDLCHL